MRGFGASGRPADESAEAGRQQRQQGQQGPRTRDRHGRGIRGVLAPARVPLSLTRAQRFDEYVLDAVELVEHAVEADEALVERLGVIEFGIEEVPPDAALLAAESGAEPLPLARSDAATSTTAGRVVLYRRPVELRTPDLQDRASLVHELVVDELAELLGVPVEQLDPPDR
jgi:Zincin-like metallopeptidase